MDILAGQTDAERRATLRILSVWHADCFVVNVSRICRAIYARRQNAQISHTSREHFRVRGSILNGEKL